MRRHIFDILSPQIKKVAVDYHHRLDEHGAPHALIGGIAVGAYGEPRATKVIDFLVAGNVFAGTPSYLGKLETVRFVVSKVPVDLIFVDRKHAFLEEAIRAARKVEGVPVLPVEALIYLKMIGGRRKDQLDIVTMILSGHVEVNSVLDYLKKHDPGLLDTFRQFVETADREG